MLKLLRYQYLTLLWALFVSAICCIHIGDAITGNGFFFLGFDKLTHTGLFFVFTVLLLFGRIKQKNTYSYSVGTILIVLLLSVVFGGGIELLQKYLFTYRSAEWWDLFCDILGSCMALFSYVFLHRMNSLEFHHPPSREFVIRNKMQISLPLEHEENEKN